ncbi:DUF4468 domain-containing protein [Massilibacteroides vaginae]|uniref:DUF4468 domain-containing protein n=1 Tax=Massilibacteroides vaginae TaxID=1673718 RepID=UPI000A1CCDCF|nr:DUF4468 domain-containing protein [Massilibacteroides vaginae]
MKKGIVLLLLTILPALCFAQGNKGKAEACAPEKEGKICYTDNINMKDASQSALYKAISKWANEEYGKDIFISNVSCNHSRKTILISSRIELLLNEKETTILKYKMYISCFDNNYKVEVKDLSFQYDPDNAKRLRTYPAESVIADNGKGNKVPSIKNPELFCNATFFFVEGLLDDVYLAAKEH